MKDLTQVFSNDLLAGGVALMLFGFLVAQLRGMPALAWRFLLSRFAVIVEVRDRELIGWVGVWLASLEYGGRCRRLLAISGSATSGDSWPVATLAPGLGVHLFRHGGRLLLLRRAIDNGKTDGPGSPFVVETLTLTLLGGDQSAMLGLFQEVRDTVRENAMRLRIAIADSWGDWRFLERSHQRDIGSVILPAEMTRHIASDVERFLEARQLYVDNSIPYRRGYLFYGPPGNGKSSMVAALCYQYGLPLYVIHLREKDFSDGKLARAIGAIPRRAALLLEDVDCVAPEREDAACGGVTLSGLLNAIDGPVATEDRLLFITTNNKESLDAALLRPGRVDKAFCFDAPTVEQAVAMRRRFCPLSTGAEEAAFRSSFEKCPLPSMAALQEVLMADFLNGNGHRGDSNGAGMPCG